MYGYSEYTPLTKEEVLRRVSEKDIFQALFDNVDIVLDRERLYKAPYRNDIHADCWFEEHEGVLCFIDFASTGKKSKTCFDVIMIMYGLSFAQSIQWCNEKFNLGLGNSSTKVKKIVVENDYIEEEKIIKSFKKRTITLLPRKFNYKDKQFWGKYEISSDNLKEDSVVAVEMYRAYSKKGKPFSVRPLDVCYAYTEFPDQRVKIYYPSGNKFNKWITNCNQDDVGSIKHLPKKGELLIISKSYKDCRVLRNLGLNSIWFQNEGMFPNMRIIKDLTKRFKHIVVWFDNDNAGITNSRIAVNYINSISPNKARSIMLPPKLLLENIKDPSDFFFHKGKIELTSFLKEKSIIKN